jgi:hypothetical protein
VVITLADDIGLHSNATASVTKIRAHVASLSLRRCSQCSCRWTVADQERQVPIDRIIIIMMNSAASVDYGIIVASTDIVIL